MTQNIETKGPYKAHLDGSRNGRQWARIEFMGQKYEVGVDFAEACAKVFSLNQAFMLGQKESEELIAEGKRLVEYASGWIPRNHVTGKADPYERTLDWHRDLAAWIQRVGGGK